jgi:FtsZ-binding cell division protein ZapB
MEDKQNSGASTAMKAGLVLTSALSILLGYLYFNARQEIDNINSENKTTIEAKNEIIKNTKDRLDSISVELDNKIAELQSMGQQVDDLMAVKAQLEKDKKNLANSKNVSIREYEEKIKGYEATLALKDAEIAKLKEENGILTTQNKTLSNERDNLANENTGLKTDKQALSDSVYTTNVKNRELSEKVTLAAALKAMNVNVNAINSRGKERDGGEYKAKRVDKVKISFKLAENPLTKKEDKVIYLRLIDPQGNVISDMATGSGVFTFGGKETVYTSKQSVFYDNSGQNVDFVYARGANYVKGKYNIELYSEGFSVGRGSFEVK